VGVGVQCLRAAIISGWLNIVININSIKDQDYVNKVREETENLVRQGAMLADKVYEQVEGILNK
jgi:formiminotetrahydrofolate cyclodeaminase